ncbi:MAG: dockerin type I repeat-containing protein [Candidatus Parcubacteria bacterium]|nr:dockerin type I repeat-containing protein [Candidatus Parcubacteria bacterium]
MPIHGKSRIRLWKISVFFLALVTPSFFAVADEYISTSYRVLEPVIVPANFSTSNNFQLWSTVGEVGEGASNSVSFQVGAGFLRYPIASSPAVSTTAGDSQVSLSWTASQGYLGWTPSGYNVGKSTASGGPYSFTSFGNVTSAVMSSLANGTTYYFIVLVKDIFGNIVATSTQVSSAPVASIIPVVNPPGGSGGGGGGGGGGPRPSVIANVQFSGRAYPMSKVNILEDGQIVLTTIAGPDSNFFADLGVSEGGDYNFSLYGEDKNGLRSSLFSFPVFITTGATTKIGGIFIAPTISVDKSEVKKGDNIAIFGQSTPQAEITINVNSESNIFVKKQSDKSGIYLLNFDSSVLELGSHSAKSKAAVDGEISQFSDPVGFKVSTKTVSAGVKKCPAKGDLNNDCKVNLVDFSIAAYWYKQPLNASFGKIELTHLNGDGKIDLIDFSIMAYYWTG